MVRPRKLLKEHNELFDYMPGDPASVPPSLRFWAGKLVTVNGWFISKETGRWLAYVCEGRCLVPEEELIPWEGKQ